MFENVLGRLSKRRYLTLTSVVATWFLSLFIMSIMPQSFFPIMNKPYFRADLIFPEGYGIDDVERNVIKIEEYLKNNDKIKSYSFTLGGSPVRYYLASSSIGPKPNFANVLIETKDAKDAQSEENKFYEYMVANYPDILTRSALFALSPVPDAAIEIGFVGDNIDTLVALTQRAQEIARKNDMVMEVRNSWGNKVPVWKPLYSQEKGLRLGITRQQMAYSLRSATNGVPLGECFAPGVAHGFKFGGEGVGNYLFLRDFRDRVFAARRGEIFEARFGVGDFLYVDGVEISVLQSPEHRDFNFVGLLRVVILFEDFDEPVALVY